jgi:hypothetical protein
LLPIPEIGPDFPIPMDGLGVLIRAPLMRGLSVLISAGRAVKEQDIRLSRGDILNCLLSPTIVPSHCEFKEQILDGMTRIMTYDRICEEGKGGSLFGKGVADGDKLVIVSMIEERHLRDNGFMTRTEVRGHEAGKPTRTLLPPTIIDPDFYLSITRPSNGGYILADACGASPNMAIVFDSIMRRWLDVCKLDHDLKKRGALNPDGSKSCEWMGNYCVIRALQGAADPEAITEEAIRDVIQEVNELIANLNAQIEEGEITGGDLILSQMLERSIKVAGLYKIIK